MECRGSVTLTLNFGSCFAPASFGRGRPFSIYFALAFFSWDEKFSWTTLSLTWILRTLDTLISMSRSRKYTGTILRYIRTLILWPPSQNWSFLEWDAVKLWLSADSSKPLRLQLNLVLSFLHKDAVLERVGGEVDSTRRNFGREGALPVREALPEAVLQRLVHGLNISKLRLRGEVVGLHNRGRKRQLPFWLLTSGTLPSIGASALPSWPRGLPCNN